MLAQQYGPASALRCDHRARADELQRGRARRRISASPGLPRIEPSAARPGAGGHARVFRCLRDLSRRRGRRHRADRDRAATSGGHAAGRRSYARRAAPAADDATRRQRGKREAADRVRVDFTGTIDGVEFPGGQAKDFAIVIGEGRMLPEFEAAITGMKAGETKSFSLTFPGRLPRAGGRGKAGAVHADGQRSRPNPHVPRARRRFREGVRHRERQRRRSARRSRGEPEARAEAQGRSHGQGAGAAGAARSRRRSRCRGRWSSGEAQSAAADGRSRACASSSRMKAAGHRADARRFPAAGRGARRAGTDRRRDRARPSICTRSPSRSRRWCRKRRRPTSSRTPSCAGTTRSPSG